MEQDSQLSIKQFEAVRVLGEGSFARVTLVKKIGCNTLYALKTVKMNRLSQKDKDNALN
jgi:serine/threonine protein kinase